MSNVGKLARIICAIFDVVLSIRLSIQCINDGNIGLVPLFVVIAFGMLMWLFDFMGPKESTSFDEALEPGGVVYTQEYTFKDADNNVNKAKAGAEETEIKKLTRK